MVDYSQLMSGVLVAATTFLGLTLVFLGQLNKTNDVKTKKELKRRQRLGWSFLLGVLVVLWVILWLANSCVWGTLLATIALIFQIGLLIPEVSPFLIIRKHQK